MVIPASGKNKGVYINILSKLTETDYAKLQLFQEYLNQLYQYTYSVMYHNYNGLSRSEQRLLMTRNIKNRDSEIIEKFDTIVYKATKHIIKVNVLENSTVYNYYVYIDPSSIQYRIKERIIWYAGIDCYNTMYKFKSWLFSANVTPNTFINKVKVFTESNLSYYPKRAYTPTEEEAYIPQIVPTKLILDKYIRSDLTTPTINNMDEYNQLLLFKPSNIGIYKTPKIDAYMTAYLKYDVEMLRRYLYECDHRVYHISIKLHLNDYYVNYCKQRRCFNHDHVLIENNERETKLAMLTFHLIPNDQNNIIRTLIYPEYDMYKLEEKYLKEKGDEFRRADEKIIGYYG